MSTLEKPRNSVSEYKDSLLQNIMYLLCLGGIYAYFYLILNYYSFPRESLHNQPDASIHA